jgi:hypothetical protein
MSSTERFDRFDKPDELVARAGLSLELREELKGDPALEEALTNFRTSVHAWSDAAYSRQRSFVVTGARVVRQRSWRQATGWAMASLLVAVGLSGGFYEHHHRLEMAKIAAARAAEQQKLASEQQSLVGEKKTPDDEEDLLAKVDSDVSREVPSAMEPLAQMMNDETK